MQLDNRIHITFLFTRLYFPCFHFHFLVVQINQSELEMKLKITFSEHLGSSNVKVVMLFPRILFLPV